MYITEKKHYLNKIVVKSNVNGCSESQQESGGASRKASRAISIRVVSGGSAIGTWNIKD